jgi:transcriptional regulator with XRE-family HTH domain
MLFVNTDSKKTIDQSLAKRIKQLREAQKLSQRQLASLTLISQQALASYELAQRRVPANLLPKLAEALNTTVDDVLGIEKRTKRGRLSQFETRVEQIRQLPTKQQKLALDMLDQIIKAS